MKPNSKFNNTTNKIKKEITPPPLSNQHKAPPYTVNQNSSHQAT